ncbi:DHA2 family efflux MFS transporter permease subunit [Solimonas terrae]|uniref:DHA2 family efflux MFS transporter permease subunit n=2 Tax=Solimonas terrae TaxID=1396819 RepID=A0A6M2BND2_9GAMM|nr:DHA2 family efflux MFS transporter permease subunit [Solimonas terrae]
MPKGPYLIAFVCGMAAFMEVLDTAIANVSLVHIAGSLSASRDEATWVLTSYLVSNAIILPMTGWLADTIGRKRYYLISMSLFTLASVLCGLATSLPALIFFRILQGIAGGALQPVSQSILADSFLPSQRSMAMAIYGMAVVSGPAIGPTLGGYITDHFSWHWIFLINAPVGLMLISMAGALLHDSPAQIAVQQRRKEHGFRVDYVGFALIVLSMGALQIMMDKGQQEDWLNSDFIVGLLATFVVATALLVYRELNHEHPIVNLRLLANPNFAVANLMIVAMGVTLLGTTLLMPQFMQVLLGYSALDAGMVMSPAAVMSVLMMPLMARLSTRVEPRILCTIGFVGIALSMLALTTLSLDVSNMRLVMLRVFTTFGVSFIFVPIQGLAYAGIAPQEIGSASAIINLMRNIGGGLGISIVTTYLARSTQIEQSHLVDRVSVLDPAYQSSVHALGGAMGSEQLAQASIAGEVARQAGNLAFIDVFYFLAGTAVLLIPIIWLSRRVDPHHAAPEGAH